MQTKLTEFDEAIEEGVTVLFVQTKAEQMRAEYGASRLGLSCCSTRWMTPHVALINFIQLFAVFNRILIARPPELGHGIHVKCHRVIWIGPEGDPGSPLRAVYAQALGRGRSFHESADAPDLLTFLEVPFHD